MSHGRIWALLLVLPLLLTCADITQAQRRRPSRAPPQPHPIQHPARTAQEASSEGYWEAQRSIEAAIQQLGAYLRAAPDGERAATARQPLHTLRRMAALAGLPQGGGVGGPPPSE